MNIAIIGAGWFGCLIADELLKRNYKVRIFKEKMKSLTTPLVIIKTDFISGFIIHDPKQFYNLKRGLKNLKKIWVSFAKKYRKTSISYLKIKIVC